MSETGLSAAPRFNFRATGSSREFLSIRKSFGTLELWRSVESARARQRDNGKQNVEEKFPETKFVAFPNPQMNFAAGGAGRRNRNGIDSGIPLLPGKSGELDQVGARFGRISQYLAGYTRLSHNYRRQAKNCMG